MTKATKARKAPKAMTKICEAKTRRHKGQGRRELQAAKAMKAAKAMTKATKAMKAPKAMTKFSQAMTRRP